MKHAARHRKWVRLLAGIILLAAVAFYALPAAQAWPWVRDVVASVKANDLNAAGLFYTDVDH